MAAADRLRRAAKVLAEKRAADEVAEGHAHAHAHRATERKVHTLPAEVVVVVG